MIIIFLAGILSAAYLLFAFFCVEKFRRGMKNLKPLSGYKPPVTIFKPVCGSSPEMSENLRSFCEQDYPAFQIIFGLHDENDLAMATVRAVIAEYPGHDISLVINPQLHGRNDKVSNLINMFPVARHGILIIADDDIRVPRDYIETIVAPLADHGVGAVTCLYYGSPGRGVTSTLMAMFINEWFLPSVLVSRALRNNKFCFGATIAVRGSVLEQIGGFNALADYLADDYMLGQLLAGHGYKIVLSHLVVENIINESGFKSWFLHELRWARTMRIAQPWGYLFSFITDTLVLGILAGWAAFLQTGRILWPVLIICTLFLVRALLQLRIQSMLNIRSAGSVWLIPVRDFLTLFMRLLCFAGNKIVWKNKSFSVNNAGLMAAKKNPQSGILRAVPEGKKPVLKTINTKTADL